MTEKFSCSLFLYLIERLGTMSQSHFVPRVATAELLVQVCLE